MSRAQSRLASLERRMTPTRAGTDARERLAERLDTLRASDPEHYARAIGRVAEVLEAKPTARAQQVAANLRASLEAEGAP